MQAGVALLTDTQGLSSALLGRRLHAPATILTGVTFAWSPFLLEKQMQIPNLHVLAISHDVI